MNHDPIHYHIAGVCALAAACCAIAGAAVSAVYGLGGQNLPVATHEQLAQVAAHHIPYLIREWLYLFLAVIAIGEGLGLYLLTRKSPLAMWALVAWVVGLTIGIVQDCSVIAIINQVSDRYAHGAADGQDSILFATGLAFDTIRVQQFIAVLLCGTVACCVFSVIGYRARQFPLWLCVVGVLSGVTTGLFVVCNVTTAFDQIQPLFENGYGLMVIWDIAIGVLLILEGNKLSVAK